ncbi:uncharacterized protein LOC129619330 [Condylostylus longicornis]|uniref:uncharacterized protein LOC129619330 n=1 Tax=Condylostylus longicornis TaxID=2530218 RepID=UPI00244DB8C9|nr:uncharacterized protein LOC129619330 [Condylostylus longicornis]
MKLQQFNLRSENKKEQELSGDSLSDDLTDIDEDNYRKSMQDNNISPTVNGNTGVVIDQAQFEADKRAVYKHPLFSLLALLLEKCEQATQGYFPQSSKNSPKNNGNNIENDAFSNDIQAFVQILEKEKRPLFTNNAELDGLMTKALQVLRIHLLELEKVQELCKDFCTRYISCLRSKMQSENLLRSDYPLETNNNMSNSNSPINTLSARNSNEYTNLNSDVFSLHQDNSLSENNFNTTNSDSTTNVTPNVNQFPTMQQATAQQTTMPISSEISLLSSSNINIDSADISQIGCNTLSVERYSSQLSPCNSSDEIDSEYDSDNDDFNSNYSNQSESKKHKRGILPKQATSVMRAWLFQHLVHPYPTEDEKRAIAAQTNLTLLQVNNWFINARRRILQPMLEHATDNTSNQSQSANSRLTWMGNFFILNTVEINIKFYIMSKRAIRKRDNSQLYQKHPVPPLRHKKLNHQKKAFQLNQISNKNCNLKRSKSYPCLKRRLTETDLYANNHQLRSKSLNDVTKLSTYYKNNKMSGNQINAKSEVCLVKISEHSTKSTNDDRNESLNLSRDINLNYETATEIQTNLVGDTLNELTLSGPIERNIQNNNSSISLRSRRTSQQGSVYSNNSSIAISPSECENHGFADTCGVRIPIIGYEIMEERARFTVYKLRVENSFTNDCWLVLRRYTDFVRLNNKLKQMFPYNTIQLQLPRKKIFGDNFNAVFLDNRVQGLQIFVNTIMANEELKSSKIVRDFFCLDEPPSYSESMEECRAIFEAQEETIAHLKLQINSKNDLILSLQEKLMNEIAQNERLKKELKETTSKCATCCKKIESLDITN